MATSTYKTYLMKGTTNGGNTTYTKLIDIKEFPDIGSTPEMLETTTLSDKMQTFILGIQSNSGLEFSANYDHSDYQALKALEGQTVKYAIWFGGSESGGTVTPDGSEGKFSFEGQLTVFPTGGSANEVRGMKIVIAPSTVITEE